MAGVLSINSIEQLYQFLNEKGVMEIAIRGKNKRFAEFQKIAFNNIGQGEEKELLKQAIANMNKSNALAENSLKVMNNISKLQQLSLLLSGLNLCATCVGFAIMAKKLDKIGGQINQLISQEKQMNGVQADYEFKKVISEHANMLDSRKTQKYYTEEQMRKLVDDEYNVLNLLVDIFIKDLSEEQEELIFSIYSLASMLSVSLRYFDEIYYINNHETIGDGDVWHSQHDNWMSVFDRMVSDAFVKKIQDHGIFDLRLSTIENDAYYISLTDRVNNMIEEILDNQIIVETLGDAISVSSYSELIDQEVAEAIKEAFEETEGALENPEVEKVYKETLKQMALSV